MLTALRKAFCWRPGSLIFAGLAFLIAAAFTAGPAVLLAQAPPGWSGWADQTQYLISAHALLHGDLTASAHWYPLLYPILLAFFAWLPDYYATLIPNLLCFLAALIGFQSVAARFGVGRWGAVLLFLPATILYPHADDPFFSILANWLIPWTTTLSSALIWLALALALRIGASPRPLREGSVLGLLLGLIPACRPADIVVSGIIGLCLFIPLLVHARRWREFASIIAASLAVIAVYLALYLRIYGPHPTNYMLLSTAYGERFAQLGWKSVLILLAPRPWYPDGEGLLALLPWLALGAAGMVLALTRKQERWAIALLGLPALAYAAVMLAYTDLLPSGLWRYHNMHYFKWLFPLGALFAWVWLRRLPRQPIAASLALALVMLPASLHYSPAPAKPDAPARLVVFQDVPAPFPDVYFSRSLVTDSTGPQYNLLDVHLVPDGNGHVLAEALHRPFTGDEQWAWPGGDPLQRPGWQFTGTMSQLPGAFPRPAIARFRARLVLGLPCWLPPYGCDASPIPASPP